MNPSQPPTLTERALTAGMYLFTGGIGLSVLFWPPYDSVTHALTAILSVVWAGFMLTALVAAPAVMYGKYLIEYALIPFFWTALLVADLAVWTRAVEEPTLVGRVCAGTALLLGLSARWYVLGRLIKAGRNMTERRRRWNRK